jgi:hypothetical protein
MRLVKSAQAVVGLAATSGLVLMLSGSAWAADSSIDTTPQYQATVAANDLAAGAGIDTPQADKLPQVPNSQGGASQVKLTTAGGTATGDATKVESTDKPSVEQKQGTNSANNATAPTTVKPVVSGVVNAQLDKPRLMVKQPAVADSFGVEGRAAAGQSVKAVDQAGVVTIVTPVVDAATKSAATSTLASVHRTATVLVIQPTITNHAATDLAALIPSAPAPAKAPVPAQSAGLLSNLTALLAGTALPQLLMPHDLAVDRLAATALNLGIAFVLLLNVVSFTYGQWLRRGGFATAARSDAPFSPLPLFATPSLLGYAALPLRTHSPHFGGGRNEILKQTGLVPNVYRKEEKL